MICYRSHQRYTSVFVRIFSDNNFFRKAKCGVSFYYLVRQVIYKRRTLLADHLLSPALSLAERIKGVCLASKGEPVSGNVLNS